MESSERNAAAFSRSSTWNRMTMTGPFRVTPAPPSSGDGELRSPIEKRPLIDQIGSSDFPRAADC
jgi:hypothetical protein